MLLVDVAMQVMSGEPVDLETPCVNVIWQGDAVAQILQCLPCADSPPFVVNVTGNDTLSVRDIAYQFAERFGVTPTFAGEEASTCWLQQHRSSTLAIRRALDERGLHDRLDCASGSEVVAKRSASLPIFKFVMATIDVHIIRRRDAKSDRS